MKNRIEKKIFFWGIFLTVSFTWVLFGGCECTWDGNEWIPHYKEKMHQNGYLCTSSGKYHFYSRGMGEPRECRWNR